MGWIDRFEWMTGFDGWWRALVATEWMKHWIDGDRIISFFFFRWDVTRELAVRENVSRGCKKKKKKRKGLKEWDWSWIRERIEQNSFFLSLLLYHYFLFLSFFLFFFSFSFPFFQSTQSVSRHCTLDLHGLFKSRGRFAKYKYCLKVLRRCFLFLFSFFFFPPLFIRNTMSGSRDGRDHG